MKGSEMKQAKIFKVKLDKDRPMTFDFNALCELQERYIDPFVAVAGLATGDVTVLRALVHASLVAGQMAVDESEEMDLTFGQVGRLLGNYLANDREAYEKMVVTLLEGVSLFLPKQAEKEEEGAGEDPKN
jgi:hypothetical protein